MTTPPALLATFVVREPRHEDVDDPPLLRIVDATQRVGALLGQYLELGDLSCCSFQAGLVLHLEDEVVFDEIDEPWMAVTWLEALSAVLAGHPSARAVPWEQSQMTLTVSGEEVTLQDGPNAPALHADLGQFARSVEGEFVAYFDFLARVREETARRRAQPGSELDKLEEIEQQFHVVRSDVWNRFRTLVSERMG